jgi:hypothetical protein
LTICASIMRAHGGGLMLGNDVRGGAVAVLTLPMQGNAGVFSRAGAPGSPRRTATDATSLAAAK